MSSRGVYHINGVHPAMHTIRFWRRQEFLFDIVDEGCDDVDEVYHQVAELVREMMTDDQEDWTGCRFEITSARGEALLSVPVLPAMSAIARQPGLEVDWQPKGFLRRQVNSFRVTSVPV
jgi:hypothetical protein